MNSSRLSLLRERAKVAQLYAGRDIDDLTDRQAELLAFIAYRMASKAQVPTSREIMEHFWFRSKNAVNDHLIALARKGYLRFGFREARSIRLTVSDGHCLACGRKLEGV